MTEFTKEDLKNKIAEEAIEYLKNARIEQKVFSQVQKYAEDSNLENKVIAHRDLAKASEEAYSSLLELMRLVSNYENWEE